MHTRSMHQRGPDLSGKKVPKCVPHVEVTKLVVLFTVTSGKISAARKLGQPCSLVSWMNSTSERLMGARKSGFPHTESKKVITLSGFKREKRSTSGNAKKFCGSAKVLSLESQHTASARVSFSKSKGRGSTKSLVFVKRDTLNMRLVCTPCWQVSNFGGTRRPEKAWTAISSTLECLVWEAFPSGCLYKRLSNLVCLLVPLLPILNRRGREDSLPNRLQLVCG